jgi:hypothetical protein
VGWLLAAMRKRMKNSPAAFRNGWLHLAAMVCMTASSGCTSVISSAYLREAWLDAVEHAAETQADAKRKGKTARADDHEAEESEVADSSSADANAGDSSEVQHGRLQRSTRQSSRRITASRNLAD